MPSPAHNKNGRLLLKRTRSEQTIRVNGITTPPEIECVRAFWAQALSLGGFRFPRIFIPRDSSVWLGRGKIGYVFAEYEDSEMLEQAMRAFHDRPSPVNPSILLRTRKANKPGQMHVHGIEDPFRF